MRNNEEKYVSKSYAVGVLALVFIIIGYQIALFVHNAALAHIVAVRDSPDTVFVYGQTDVNDARAEVQETEPVMERRNSAHHPFAEKVRDSHPASEPESFRFDPNTATMEEFCRLGFSPAQARSILNYRGKGGRFRRKTDFAESFVVSDRIYARLEPYIDIPLVDLNRADSAELDALPGIGGWFASRILEHRRALGGFSYKEQLMDIYRFDRERYDALSDLVTVDTAYVSPYHLWSLPADSLAKHPYIRNIETARSIVLFRENNPDSCLTVSALEMAGIIGGDDASRLSGCMIASP